MYGLRVKRQGGESKTRDHRIKTRLAGEKALSDRSTHAQDLMRAGELLTCLGLYFGCLAVSGVQGLIAVVIVCARAASCVTDQFSFW
jgi:hypothetical protein